MPLPTGPVSTHCCTVALRFGGDDLDSAVYGIVSAWVMLPTSNASIKSTG